MKTIVVANQKGGVAKTTTCGALVSVLGRKGYRTLGIDMDPQGTFTDNSRCKQSEHGVYSVMRKEEPIRDCIQHTNLFDLLPASIMMSTLEQELSGQIGRECRLREGIEADRLSDLYDFVIIDCPPALGTLTVNALVCGDYVLVPTNADINAVKGIVQLNIVISQVRTYFNRDLKVAGILQTRDNKRLNISKEVRKVAEMAAESIQCNLLETRIVSPRRRQICRGSTSMIMIPKALWRWIMSSLSANCCGRWKNEPKNIPPGGRGCASIRENVCRPRRDCPAGG